MVSAQRQYESGCKRGDNGFSANAVSIAKQAQSVSINELTRQTVLMLLLLTGKERLLVLAVKSMMGIGPGGIAGLFSCFCEAKISARWTRRVVLLES